MAVHDRTRLNGQLHFFDEGPPVSSGRFPLIKVFSAMSPIGDARISCNCLIFKHNHLMRYFQYAQYPIVFIGLLPQE